MTFDLGTATDKFYLARKERALAELNRRIDAGVPVPGAELLAAEADVAIARRILGRAPRNVSG
jgi:hypothetical protein